MSPNNMIIKRVSVRRKNIGEISNTEGTIDQCFSTAGPPPGTESWHQLYRAATGSRGICHFSFLSIVHE
jgi:hypothetical protein